MKWMIASDLHGSAFYCRQMLDAFEREGAERLLLLGDLLYHGPRNDLPRGYAPKLVYATHGHSYNTKNPPPLMPGDILLHGHTHVPAWQEFGEGNLYLNPGSLSIPKENSPHSYMTLEEGLFRWKELESGEVYHQIKV
jgi:predicted phosphodiesterase